MQSPWPKPSAQALGDPYYHCVECDYSQVRIRFNQEAARKERSWVSGLSWGIQTSAQWTHGYFGGIIIVSQIIEPTQVHSIGPNPVEKIDSLKIAETYPTPSLATLDSTSSSSLGPPVHIPNLGKSDPLWKLVRAAYTTLNQTSPEATESCWLCYTLYPPYYEAIGLNASYSLTTSIDPPKYHWGEQKVSLTMKEVWGKGLCVGKVPPEKSPLCARSAKLTEIDETKRIIPEAGGWWVCSHTGLTPCLHVSVFNQNREFCILMAVVPKNLIPPRRSYI